MSDRPFSKRDKGEQEGMNECCPTCLELQPGQHLFDSEVLKYKFPSRLEQPS